MSRFRTAALLLLVLALMTGLASAQVSLKTTEVGSGGSTTQITYTPTSGPGALAPAAGKYWDSLASTDYYVVPPYISAPPNPQIGVGPDDVLVIVNRRIARYPNPNAAGNTLVTNPYNNPPTEQSFLDVWTGIPALTGNGNPAAALCPSGTSNNQVCVIDNASIRYDQMQGRFVVIYTVTDVPAHRSNLVLIVSKFSQFTKCSTAPAPPTCPASSPLFTPPVIAPVVGGTQTGGINTANWVMYILPINLSYAVTQPTALGNGVVGTVNTVFTGGQSGTFDTDPFCGTPTNNPGGPPFPPNPATTVTCTDYYPTAARMGMDNDNLIFAIPVLDKSFSFFENTLPQSPGQVLGPYAGTRVITVPKLVVYNGTGMPTTQPPACTPNACGAVNLGDNLRTGTITLLGSLAGGGSGCATAPLAVGTCAPTFQAGNPIGAIFWEPDNLRGRALASFDAQVSGPWPGNPTAGIITPFDYLVGTRIGDNQVGNFGAGPGATGVQIWALPIVFSCPGSAIYPGPAGVTFCGVAAGGQVPDLPLLSSVRSLFTLTSVDDPAPVGQGESPGFLFTNHNNVPISSLNNKRLFVGDSRPEQVMFREGLLYMARTVRLSDWPPATALGTATVSYDIMKTCSSFVPALSAILPPGVALTNPTCGPYSVNASAGGFPSPVLAIETQWFNGTNVPDPSGDINGFGFYTPMFESPADVVNSGPVSPINLFPWFEKLFVGMTTGGTSNVANTFSTDFPSLWDFRPGDDGYDTVQPYLDPYSGTVFTTVPCPGNVTTSATVTNGSAAVTVGSTQGLGAGMFVVSVTLGPGNPGSITGASVPSVPPTTIVSISGNTVTLSAPVTVNGGSSAIVNITFSRNPNNITQTAVGNVSLGLSGVTSGSNTIFVGSLTGLTIGQAITGTPTATHVALASLGGNNIAVDNLGNVGNGETVVGTTTTIGVATAAGDNHVTVPAGSLVAVGETVTGGSFPAGTTVTGIGALSPTTSGIITLSNPAASTNSFTNVTFSSAPFFAGGTFVGSEASNVGSPPVNVVALVDNTGAPISPLIASFGPNGIPVQFQAPSATLFPVGTTILNIQASGSSSTPNCPAGTSNCVILSNPANNPLFGVAGLTSTSNVPITFSNVAVGNTVAVTCPMIPWSSRGGASTDPNDGSLWLYGEFAKNRLSTIPGPGQWGTSVANYQLDFPATDPYDNDNTFFGDVPFGSTFFTWIQIAKNQGIAVASATGPCPATPAGNPPIQQPPPPGTLPVPGPASLVCPQFSPNSLITRAEMAYWVVRGQMDEEQVGQYLCNTGGDPTGISCPGGSTAASFADVLAGGTITNPFLPGTVSNAQLARYIEVMYRRGYTKGCGVTSDATRTYCPNSLLTRGQMAVFLIRAKMSNVFPTTLSGIPLTSPYGDNFGLFQQSVPYFTDEPTTDAFYIYIQKMRELRISNGKGSPTTYAPNDNLSRAEIATFIIRAFFL